MSAWVLGFVVGLPVWFLLGTVVLAAIDDDDLSLLGWASACPLGVWLPVMAWPIVAWFWLGRERK